MLEELDNILSMYMDKGTVIIMGDMNAKISPRAHSGRKESRDRCLIDFLNDNNLVSACTLDVHRGTMQLLCHLMASQKVILIILLCHMINVTFSSIIIFH